MVTRGTGGGSRIEGKQNGCVIWGERKIWRRKKKEDGEKNVMSV